MDTTADFIRAIDESMMEQLKRAVEESIQTLSKNVHNILKLMRDIKRCFDRDSTG